MRVAHMRIHMSFVTDIRSSGSDFSRARGLPAIDNFLSVAFVDNALSVGKPVVRHCIGYVWDMANMPPLPIVSLCNCKHNM